MTVGGRATVALLALGGAGGAALWGATAYRLVYRPLGPGLEAALAQALGVERERVSIRRAYPGWPGQLILDDVSTGEWAATRVEVAVDPWAALGGRWKPSRARARGLFCDLGAVDEAEATWGGGRARLVLRRVTSVPLGHWLGGLGVSLGEVGIDVESGGLKRLAFTAARVGPVDGLAGAAVRAPGGWLVRAARPGLSASAHLDHDGVAGQVRLESYPLHGWPAPRGVELAGAVADGSVAFAGDATGARASVDVAVAGAALDHRAIARRRVDGVGATVAGTIARAGDVVRASGLRLGVGRASVVLDGELARDGRIDATATLPSTSCADLLASIPRPLAPHLAGLIVDGDLAGRLRVRGTTAAGAPPLQLGVDGTLGCRVRADAALADVAALGRADAAALVNHRVDGHPFALSTRNPSWRALDSLPPSLVRTFLIAEDGRFYAHHGFDFERIGRALSADVAAQRFARGASTITQQVAKNLFLDGDRSLSRKLEEAVLAWRLEQVLDKRRILELYLNLVELGPNIYGVADAAERYFGKLPDELSADEAAQLAALLPAPRHGMDPGWDHRYHALLSRLPTEKVSTRPTPVKLSRR